jgi:hypothetical protein
MEAFENDIFPDIGKRPIAEIEPLEALTTLRKLEKRGVLDKLRKVRQACKQVCTYAIVTGRAKLTLCRTCQRPDYGEINSLSPSSG